MTSSGVAVEAASVPDAALLASLEQEMAVVVRRVRRALAQRARAVDPDLQTGGYLVLSHLADRGPCRGAEVVDCLGIDKSVISRQVQHLVDLGLVERSPDPADGRAHLVDVTPLARRRLAAVVAGRRTRLEEQLSGWSPAELGAFVAALARYNEALAD